MHQLIWQEKTIQIVLYTQQLPGSLHYISGPIWSLSLRTKCRELNRSFKLITIAGKVQAGAFWIAEFCFDISLTSAWHSIHPVCIIMIIARYWWGSEDNEVICNRYQHLGSYSHAVLLETSTNMFIPMHTMIVIPFQNLMPTSER